MALLQFGYYFPVSEQKNLLVKDDSSLYRFQVLLRHYQYHHNSAPYLNCHHHHSCAPHHHNCLYFLWHICHNLLLDCQCSHWSAPSTNNIRKQDWPDMVVHILLSIYNMNMKSNQASASTCIGKGCVFIWTVLPRKLMVVDSVHCTETNGATFLLFTSYRAPSSPFFKYFC